MQGIHQKRLLLSTLLLSISVQSFGVPITTPAVLTLYGNALYANAPSLPYANPNAPKGGRMTLQAVGSTFDSFNTFINKGTPVEGTELLSDSLTTASLDEPFARYPLLADTVTRDVDDPSWIIYHINSAAKFSDGTPVTAADVAFTFNIIKEKGQPSLQMYFADIKSVKALNKQEVRFDFKTKNNHEIALTVGEISILSMADWKKRPFDKVSMQPYLGSGAYTVKSIDNGRSITYQRNPNYWAKDLPINSGKYNFDEMKYQYYRSDEVAFEAFKAGQYTIRQESKARNWAKNYNFPAVKSNLVIKQLIPHQKPVSMQALVFNLRKDKFKPLKVRQAIDYAFDFEWMNKAIFNMGYTRLQSFFYNSELEAKGTPSVAELTLLKPLLGQLSAAEQHDILSPWQQFKTDGSGFNRIGLLKARELLLETGYHYQAGKLVDINNKPFDIEILISAENMQRVVLPFVRNLKRLGINASIRQVDTPQYIERGRRFDYDMVIDQFPQSLSPGNEQMGYWHSSSAHEEGTNNSAGIQSPVVDSIVEQLVQAKDRDALLNITHVLDRVLRAEHYMIPMYGLPAFRIAYWNQFDMPKIRPKYALGLEYWWFNPVGARKMQTFLGQPETTSTKTPTQSNIKK